MGAFNRFFSNMGYLGIWIISLRRWSSAADPKLARLVRESQEGMQSVTETAVPVPHLQIPRYPHAFCMTNEETFLPGGLKQKIQVQWKVQYVANGSSCTSNLRPSETQSPLTLDFPYCQ